MRIPSRGWLGGVVLLLPLILPGLGAGPVLAQSGLEGLSLGLGVAYHQQADDMVSPLRYSGLTWGPSLSFGFPTETQIRRSNLSLGFPKLASSRAEFGAHREKGYRAELDFALFHRVAQRSESSLAFYLGAELRVDFALYDHWYTGNDTESWMHLFGLFHPGGAWSLTVPWGGEIWQEVTIPLMGLAMRPGYQGMTEFPDVTWEGVGSVWGVHQSINYLRSAGARVRWGLSYDYRALRHSKPRSLAWTRQMLTLFVTVWEGGR